MKKLMELSTAAIALATVIGVGFGIATFLAEFTSLVLRNIGIILGFYIFGMILSIEWLRRKIE